MDLGLYILTVAVPGLGRDHYDVAAAAVEGGATAVQLRVKGFQGDKEAIKLACAVHELTQSAGIPLIINDYADVAVAAGAEGVHVGANDMPVAAVRRMLGPRAMIGASAANSERAMAVEREGADYLGVGAIYRTATKPAKTPVGPAAIAQIKMRVGIPVVAIGGITAGNLGACIEAGADGVAVISAVAGAKDMVAATKELKEALDLARSAKAERGGEVHWNQVPR